MPAPRAASTADATHTVKIVGLRRKIAQKMQDAKRRIPHFTYVEEIDVSELEALRARLNAKWGAQRGHLTLLALLIRAIVLAVREFPQVNARFDDEAGVLTLHDAVHLGIATQTDAGLMVPVLRNAQAQDLWASATEVVRLSEAARSGKAVRDELTGSTITITSLGRLGGIVSTPVINHPEVAIVGVNRIAMRPVIRDGAIVAAPDDEPVVVVRPSRGRRRGRRRLRAEPARPPRAPGHAVHRVATRQGSGAPLEALLVDFRPPLRTALLQRQLKTRRLVQMPRGTEAVEGPEVGARIAA